MKVRAKIILGFSVPMLMFGALGLWLLLVMESASDHLRYLREESVALVLMAKDMETDVTQVQQFLSDISATRALNGLDDGFKDAETHYNEFNFGLGKFEQMFAAKGDQKNLERCKQIRTKFNTFYENGIKMAHAYIDGGTPAGNKLMLDFDKDSLALQVSMSPFIQSQLDEMDAVVEKFKNDADQARIAGVTLGLLAAVISILIARATVLAFTLYLTQRKKAESALRLARRELKGKNLILGDEKELLEDIVTRMRSASPLDERKLKHIKSSLERTTGDIILSAYRPDGAQHVIVGDFSGHGLPAAVGGPLVSYAFYRLTADGCSMRHIIMEVNRILCRHLPIQLNMAAIALELSPDRKQMMAWNCGMPPVLYLSSAHGMDRIISRELPLGFSESIDIAEPHTQAKMEPDTHIYLYSDGITEAMSVEQELYGQERLEALVSRIYAERLPLEVIWAELDAFSGSPKLSDDAVMVEILP